MRPRVKQGITVSVILAIMLTITPLCKVEAETVHTNDLHPEDGTPAFLKEDVPMYDSKDLTGEPVITIDKSTVIRTLKENSMLYNGKVLFFDPSDVISGDDLTKYVVTHAQKFDKKVTACEQTYLYDPTTYDKLAAVNPGAAFLICSEDDKFYTVNFDDQKALLYKESATEELYVKVTTYNGVTESLEEILQNLKDLALKLGRDPITFDYSAESGNVIVNFAMRFVGNPYVWGGNSLTDGCDCSGFTQQIYAHFGVDLPRHSGNQATVGSEVSVTELQPGDLLFFNRGNRIGHVAMYAGNGMIVHAKGSQYGIVMEKLKETPAVCRRYLTDLEETNFEK